MKVQRVPPETASKGAICKYCFCSDERIFKGRHCKILARIELSLDSVKFCRRSGAITFHSE
jgi:hypothetical protein